MLVGYVAFHDVAGYGSEHVRDRVVPDGVLLLAGANPADLGAPGLVDLVGAVFAIVHVQLMARDAHRLFERIEIRLYGLFLRVHV